MESLGQNTEYQILKLRVKLIDINLHQNNCINKYGFDDRFKKFEPSIKILNHQLGTIKEELTEMYNSIMLNSDNVIELHRIANLLLCFETVEKSILLDIQSKITELITIKEDSLKQYDFRTANTIREEIRLLQQYFNKHK